MQLTDDLSAHKGIGVNTWAIQYIIILGFFGVYKTIVEVKYSRMSAKQSGTDSGLQQN